MRAGWRLLLWIVMTLALRFALQVPLVAILRATRDPLPGDTLRAVGFIFADGTALIATLLSTWIMARVEGRKFRDYGIPCRDAFDRQFWGGCLFGFLAVALLIGLIAALGGYSLGTLALHGAELATFTVLWFLASLAIGFAEEFFFRAYPQVTLATGIGFWPAAVVISVAFGALHYFTKPFERWPDWACTSLIALLLCLMLRRTGSLKFAIGMHAGFDFAAIFVFSGPNGGKVAFGRLFNASFHGPYWLTGGPLGPEASLLVFPVIALMFVAFHLLYPQARFMVDPSAQSVARTTN